MTGGRAFKPPSWRICIWTPQGLHCVGPNLRQIQTRPGPFQYEGELS